MPAQAIPKSIASAGTLAHIVTAKYIDALPLYRQENIFNRMGIEVARGSMANWVIRVAMLLENLVELMKQTLLSANYIHADETTVQVLDEKNKPATSKSFMWVAATDEHANCPQVVVFEYHETRSAAAATDFLEGFRGYLQVDGYASYNSVCKNTEIVRLGCWAHVRRKFFEVIENGASNNKGIAQEIFTLIKRLYKIEDEISKQNLIERFERRKTDSLALLNEIKAKVDDNIAQVPQKSKLGMALAYTTNEWPTLTVFTTDPRLAIDNNFVENAIRPFALGRKNWLFSQSPEGAHASAKIYSLLETAKRNNLNPHAYLKDLLDRIPNIQNKDELHALLPWNWKPPDKA